jgi:hypothetical protein
MQTQKAGINSIVDLHPLRPGLFGWPGKVMWWKRALDHFYKDALSTEQATGRFLPQF